MKRGAIQWLGAAGLGAIVAPIFGSLGPIPGAGSLVVAFLLLSRIDRAVALSGLLVGLGGAWLALLEAARQRGGTFDEGSIVVFTLAYGAVPLAVGVAIAVWAVVGRGLSRRGGR